MPAIGFVDGARGYRQARVNIIKTGKIMLSRALHMTNTVFCCHFKKELPALSKAPLSGPLGALIKEHVSESAWQEWLEVQIKIINEERLDLSEENAQERLYHQMVTFLGLEQFIS